VEYDDVTCSGSSTSYLLKMASMFLKEEKIGYKRIYYTLCLG